MKKIALALGLCLSLTANSYATNDAVEQLNTEMQKILAPLQDENTVHKFALNSLGMDSDRVTEIGLSAFSHKAGSDNILELKLDNLQYRNDNVKAPETSIKGSINFDFTKVVSSELINRIISNLPEAIETIVSDHYSRYDNAVSVKSGVTSTTKDEQGNYTGFTALIAVRIDLDKLPDPYDRDSVSTTDAVISITLNTKSGASFDAFILSNPEYYGFNDNAIGLKNLIDSLLAHDEFSIIAITNSVTAYDRMLSEIAEWSDYLNAWKLKLIKGL